MSNKRMIVLVAAAVVLVVATFILEAHPAISAATASMPNEGVASSALGANTYNRPASFGAAPQPALSCEIAANASGVDERSAFAQYQVAGSARALAAQRQAVEQAQWAERQLFTDLGVADAASALTRQRHAACAN